MTAIARKISQALKTYLRHQRLPLHIEFNLSDYCNLNCKGCSHYSPLAPDLQESLESLRHSMEKISSIKGVEKIKTVYLIGGETLLYRNLCEAIEMARKFFPKAELKVFTNGLLLPKMSEEFWETCRNNRVNINITRYPVKFDYDGVEKLCRDKGIEYEIYGDRSLKDSFLRFPLDPKKRHNPRVSHFRCTSFGCVTVDNGRIFPCSQSACMGHLNDRFSTDFKWEKGDYISVDDLHDVKQIFRLRNRPVPFCGYCGHTETTEYGPSARSASEWIDI